MKSRKLHNYQILANFQKRALYRLQFLHRKLSIFIKWTDFSEISWSQEITNEQIFKGFPARFQKRASYRLVYLYEILSIFIKSPDFNEIKEND